MGTGSFLGDQCSNLRLWGRLHDSETHTLNGRIVWYVNYSNIRLVFPKLMFTKAVTNKKVEKNH